MHRLRHRSRRPAPAERTERPGLPFRPASRAAGAEVGRELALDAWRAMLDRSRDELMAELGAGDADVAPGVSYEGLKGVDRIHVPSAHPGYFYVSPERVELIYVGEAGLQGVDGADLQGELGGPGEILRSRAGKRSKLHVYPDRGVAFAEQDGRVQILELFHPTTLAGYRDRIYVERGAFIR